MTTGRTRAWLTNDGYNRARAELARLRGEALHGARVGERRAFRLPTGEMTAVTLTDAAPYRAEPSTTS